MSNPYIVINWMEGYGNSPRIEIHNFKYTTDRAALRYTKRHTIHRADQGPIVRYFSSDGKPTNGFGGAEFSGTFVDGTTFKYQGAWSSRAGAVNIFWPEDRIVDVDIGMYATAVKADWFIELWRKQAPDFGLAWVRAGKSIETVIMPTRGGKLKDDRYYEIIEHIA